MQGSQHEDRRDGGTSKLGRDIRRDPRKAQHMDSQHFAGATRRFEIFAAVVPQTEVQTLADRGLLDHVGMAFQLIADCGADEIGPVRVETFLHHEVDLPEVDVAEINRDLLAVTGFGAELLYNVSHGVPSDDHLVRWYMDGGRTTFKRDRRGPIYPQDSDQNETTAISCSGEPP
jgi:hypothetical protein